MIESPQNIVSLPCRGCQSLSFLKLPENLTVSWVGTWYESRLNCILRDWITGKLGSQETQRWLRESPVCYIDSCLIFREPVPIFTTHCSPQVSSSDAFHKNIPCH